MTPTTIPTRPERDPAELDVLAEVAGRLVTAAAQLSSQMHEADRRRPTATLSLILADAALLARILGDRWGRADCELIVDRLAGRVHPAPIPKRVVRDLIGDVNHLSRRLDEAMGTPAEGAARCDLLANLRSVLFAEPA